MKSNTSQKKIVLKGKVVQIFETSGEKAARIYIEHAAIDLLININEEVNLGDAITFEMSINDKSIKPNNNDINIRQL